MKTPRNPVDLKGFFIETGIANDNANYGVTNPTNPKPKVVNASGIRSGSSNPKWGSWNRDNMKEL